MPKRGERNWGDVEGVSVCREDLAELLAKWRIYLQKV